MQHVWEFLCEPKGEPGMEPKEPINRMFVSESSRKNKVAIGVKKALLKNFAMKEEDIENLYIRQLR